MAMVQRNTAEVAAPQTGLSPRDIARLSVIADREAGIVLGDQKADFLISRLSDIVNRAGLVEFSAYCDLLESAGSQDHVRQFVEAITTHTTNFFRENGHYNWLRDNGFQALWDTGAGRDRDLVIWSAACSTGQELMSALITGSVWRSRDRRGLRIKGIGTDLSRRVVRTAQNAVYSRDEIAGIPEEYRRKFLLSSRHKDGLYRIEPNLRRLAEWRVANLTAAATLQSISADVVFLRNVLIYFDSDTQSAVIQNVLSRLRPGGVLMTGHSETAHARSFGLSVIAPTIYQKDAS